LSSLMWRYLVDREFDGDVMRPAVLHYGIVMG
jgi:hypothetical protein